MVLMRPPFRSNPISLITPGFIFGPPGANTDDVGHDVPIEYFEWAGRLKKVAGDVTSAFVPGVKVSNGNWGMQLNADVQRQSGESLLSFSFRHEYNDNEDTDCYLRIHGDAYGAGSVGSVFKVEVDISYYKSDGSFYVYRINYGQTGMRNVTNGVAFTAANDVPDAVSLFYHDTNNVNHIVDNWLNLEGNGYYPGDIIAGVPTGTEMFVRVKVNVNDPNVISPKLEGPFVPLRITHVPPVTIPTAEPVVTVPVTAAPTTATKWNGRAETRTRTFGVMNTAENKSPCLAGDAQKVANYLLSVEGLYAGYHIIVDEDNTIVFQDPATRRAYGSYGGNDGIQLAFACNARHWETHYQKINSNSLYKALLRMRSTLDHYNISKTRLSILSSWTRVEPTDDDPGYIIVPASSVGVIGHGDIQSNRSDPGRYFPWGDLLAGN